MEVNLNKDELADLVSGTEPNYHLFENPIIKKCGSFNGSYGTWSWNRWELLKLTEEQLFALYKLCKNSWGESLLSQWA
jgi:hypothetical protein